MSTLKFLQKKFKTSEKLTKQGAPFVVAKDDNGKEIIFKILYLKDCDKAQSYLSSQKSLQFSKNKLNPPTLEELRTVQRNVLVKFIVVGWENVLDESNNVLPFDKDLLMEQLKKLPELVDLLFDASKDPDNFKEQLEQEEEEIKNS